MLKARGQSSEEGMHTYKRRFLNALVLTSWNLSNSNCLSKTKQRERPLEVYYVMSIIYWWHHNIYISVGLSALLVSTDRTMRELLHRGSGTELAPRFLCAWVNLRLCYQVLGSTWSLIQQWKLNIIKGN